MECLYQAMKGEVQLSGGVEGLCRAIAGCDMSISISTQTSTLALPLQFDYAPRLFEATPPNRQRRCCRPGA
jgi:hypothetical protein